MLKCREGGAVMWVAGCGEADEVALSALAVSEGLNLH